MYLYLRITTSERDIVEVWYISRSLKITQNESISPRNFENIFILFKNYL